MSAFGFTTDETDPVGFALAYPFARPAGSFVFRAGLEAVSAASEVAVKATRTGRADAIAVPLVDVEAVAEGTLIRIDGAVPVLASGSNAAPAQLARKYRDHPEIGLILVHEVRVPGIASVYSAHVARYGAVAATLAPCRGFVARLHLLFVPADGFARLNRTESLGQNYCLAILDGSPLELRGASVAPLAYVSRRGPARFGRAPLRLPDTDAAGEGPEVADQPAVQRRLMSLLGEDGPLEAFVGRLIADDAFRAAATRRLAGTTERVLPEGARLLAGD